MANKKSYAGDLRGIAFWTKHFRGKYISSITRTDIAKHVEASHDNDATRNRYISVIRALLRKAEREWEWLDRAPTVKRYKEPSGRIRWITADEALRLLDRLPPWFKPMAVLALATGMRQSNVCRLRWDQINMQLRTITVPADEFKSGRVFVCHLNQQAIDVIRAQIGKHDTQVFVDKKGKPINGWRTSFDTRWAEGCAAANINDFHWHDLRHTWASWHVQNGTDIYELKELGGWETIEMPMRYAHFGDSKLKSAAGRVTNLSQLPVLENEKASVQAG